MKASRTAICTSVLLALAGGIAGCDDRSNDASRNGTTPSTTNSDGTTSSPATTSTSDSRPANAQPDNTAVNERDRKTSNPTPVNQSESAEDIRITAEIRKAVLMIDKLSINGQNCKIITRSGVVTLRGPVASQDERDLIAAKARAIAGVTSVVNELEVTRP